MDKAICAELIESAARYETASFLYDDPSWFMHRVTGARNQETMAFMASCLSYGSRKQFFSKIQFLLDSAKGNCFDWVREGAFTHDIPDNHACFYRLYTNHTIFQLLSVLRELFMEYGSLYRFAAQVAPDKNALTFIERLTSYFDGRTEAIPINTKSSCKRICMFLRWMVRDHSEVDLGIWKDLIDKTTLLMPMDTHVIQEANRLGLLHVKSPGMRAAIQLTETMRQIFPDDPLKGDFALFGYGINH